SLSEFHSQKNAKDIFKNLLSNNIYIAALNKHYSASYKLIKDFDFNPIAVLRVDFPKDIYNEIKKATHFNQFIFLAFSLLSVFSMSFLVHIFFKLNDIFTSSFSRFVPTKILRMLRRKNISHITLGDFSRRVVSVLFMDIRNFTAISEQLTPKENFDLINKILKEITPAIANNRGFIDKYIGDAIMAVFVNKNSHADDAVSIAV